MKLRINRLDLAEIQAVADRLGLPVASILRRAARWLKSNFGVAVLPELRTATRTNSEVIDVMGLEDYCYDGSLIIRAALYRCRELPPPVVPIIAPEDKDKTFKTRNEVAV